MFIDAHCHILPDSFPQRHAQLLAQDATYATLFPTPDYRMATAEDLIQAMDKVGLDKAVVTSMGWVGRELAVEVNDYIIQSAAHYPDQIIGFCAVNPAWGNAALEELERCAAAGLRGIGELHPDTQKFDITDRSVMLPIMDAARGLGWPVLVHASEPVGHLYPGKGQTTPDKLYRFIQNFPENIIICAHWGGGLPFYTLMPEVPEALKNVYFDTAASPFLYRPEVFAAVAGLVGAGKILFGTDYPLIRHRRLLRQVKESGLDAEAQRAILGDNMACLLRL
jgi:predicted TIM-barrel fold metal-dependent hydrolase